MKRIILCADDYGQDCNISQGIIDLIQQNRLSATSCITTMPDWFDHAKALKPFVNQIEVGLHLNLTDGVPLSSGMQDGALFPSLFNLLQKAYRHHLDSLIIETECCLQLERFILGMGRLPDFIDGHQHVHQFPVIRDVVIRLYETHLAHHKSYIRCVDDRRLFLTLFRSGYFKRIIIQLCGAKTFKMQLLQAKIPHNTSFSGIYRFSSSDRYSQLFPRFIQEIDNDGIIMCHPGLTCLNTHQKKGRDFRYDEYQYFQSPLFDVLRNDYSIQLSRK